MGAVYPDYGHAYLPGNDGEPDWTYLDPFRCVASHRHVHLHVLWTLPQPRAAGRGDTRPSVTQKRVEAFLISGSSEETPSIHDYFFRAAAAYSGGHGGISLHRALVLVRQLLHGDHHPEHHRLW